MTLALVLIAVFVSFQIFWNGFMLCNVLHLAENETLSFWKAWEQEVEENGWTGWKAFPPKAYYFIPVIVALVSKTIAKTSSEEAN